LETVGFRHSCDHEISVGFRDCSPGIFLSVLSALHGLDCHDFDSLSFIKQHPCCPRRTRRWKPLNMGSKAEDKDFVGRFREIVSDPLNLAIRRDPRAGFVEGQHVFLHNGLRVSASGPLTYYGDLIPIAQIRVGIRVCCRSIGL
jgi:hypothetical protein